MANKHIADREAQWAALNVTPDFCKVGKKIIPFDIARTLDRDKTLYARSVFARGEPVLMIDSVAAGVRGNAGRGIKSGVSQGAGHVWMREGSSTVYAEGRKVLRHLDACLMNCRLGGAALDVDLSEAD
ncbi:PAAR-like domain-containing protein [Thauera butanivorans]|uniref:PAAR-like domain-containing protein n=1 Tax=Thauera butanivorans TaxID=86174 RepID=UPI000838D793|nr:PAAR-like domain-containing protein [Thauera butanivorans]